MLSTIKREDTFSRLPTILETLVLDKLDFESLLSARATCYDWNQISKEMLPSRANLSIQIDSSSKPFKHGHWKRCLMGSWEEISIHCPINSPSLAKQYFSRNKSSGFTNFENVKTIRFFENGNGSFLDFINTVMASIPAVHSVHIRESPWKVGSVRYSTIPPTPFHTLTKSWRRGMQALSRITTFSIIFVERPGTLAFLRAVKLAHCSLVTLDLGFSKSFDGPSTALEIRQIYVTISKIILNSQSTLENLRLEWDYWSDDCRTLGNADSLEPYVEFLLMLSINLDEFKSLQLKVLALSFPRLTFLSTVVYDIFVPFIASQGETLEKLHLSRIKFDSNWMTFHSKFDLEMSDRFTYGVYMMDLDHRDRHRLVLSPHFRSLDFYSIASEYFNPSLLSISRAGSSCSRNRWQKHPMSILKVYNFSGNLAFRSINFKDLLNSLSSLIELEFIDCGLRSGSGYRFSNAEFNCIFMRCPGLKSLKITNLQALTDAGLTLLNKADVNKMKHAGVYYQKLNPERAPIAQACCLKYLELRDVSSKVSDLSVYYAFQFIPNLETISVNGNHRITKWGERVLMKKFFRNPIFNMYIQRVNISSRPSWSDFP